MNVLIVATIFLIMSLVSAPIIGVGTALGLHHLGGAIGNQGAIYRDENRFAELKEVLAKNSRLEESHFSGFREKWKYETKMEIVNKFNDLSGKMPKEMRV